MLQVPHKPQHLPLLSPNALLHRLPHSLRRVLPPTTSHELSFLTKLLLPPIIILLHPLIGAWVILLHGTVTTASFGTPVVFMWRNYNSSIMKPGAAPLMPIIFLLFDTTLQGWFACPILLSASDTEWETKSDNIFGRTRRCSKLKEIAYPSYREAEADRRRRLRQQIERQREQERRHQREAQERYQQVQERHRRQLERSRQELGPLGRNWLELERNRREDRSRSINRDENRRLKDEAAGHQSLPGDREYDQYATEIFELKEICLTSGTFRISSNISQL